MYSVGKHTKDTKLEHDITGHSPSSQCINDNPALLLAIELDDLRVNHVHGGHYDDRDHRDSHVKRGERIWRSLRPSLEAVDEENRVQGRVNVMGIGTQKNNGTEQQPS